MKYAAVILLVAIFSLALVSCKAEKVRYDNYHVYQLKPETKEQLEIVKQLEGAGNSYIFIDAVHYLKSKIHVVVAPEKVLEFSQTLENNSVPFELVDTNAQASLEDDEVADPKRRNGDYDWSNYHLLEETYDWLRSLETKYPGIVTTFVAGQSYEGRQILGVKISYGPNRKGIFIEGGMHAREWIGPATTTYVLNQVLTSEDKEVRTIAESFDWYFVPTPMVMFILTLPTACGVRLVLLMVKIALVPTLIVTGVSTGMKLVLLTIPARILMLDLMLSPKLKPKPLLTFWKLIWLAKSMLTSHCTHIRNCYSSPMAIPPNCHQITAT